MKEQQTKRVTPLLVELYDTHKLYALASNKNDESRMKLASIIMEILNLDPNDKESELIADVLVSLFKQVETEMKQVIAEKLATNDKVPLRLILHIANEPVSISEQVLLKSSVLGELDLMYLIQSNGQEHWRVLAKRADITGRLVDMLAETGDLITARNLADNNEISITEYACSLIENMAIRDQNLASSMIARHDLPVQTAKRIYTFVSNELREQISCKFPEIMQDIDTVIDEVIVDFVDEHNETVSTNNKNTSINKESKRYSAYTYAKRLHEDGKLTLSTVMSTLRKGLTESFVAQFAMYSDISVENMYQILCQENAQGLSIICKAMGISKQDFVSIYLLTGSLRNKAQNSLSSGNNLNKAIECYSKLRSENAIKIMEEFRD